MTLSGSRPTFSDLEAAARRLRPYLRQTPLLNASHALEALPGLPAGELWLKAECLQVTGSFKARGALNCLLSLEAGQLERGLVTASGGNHGLGVAYAGRIGSAPTTVFLPESSPPAKVAKLRRFGASVELVGSVWDEANAAALAHAEATGATYVHPFADPAVIAGQGTLGLELARAPELSADPSAGLDAVLVAIGGGGLISGLALALQSLSPDTRVIGVEPSGAPTLERSLAAGSLVTLPEIKTAASSLAPRRSEALPFELIQERVERVVLVEDDALRAAARWLWFEQGLACELSAAAGVAALLSGACSFPPGSRVATIVCGSGDAGLR